LRAARSRELRGRAQVGGFDWLSRWAVTAQVDDEAVSIGSGRKADEVLLVHDSLVRPAQVVGSHLKHCRSGRDGRRFGTQQEQIDISGRTLDQALGNERRASGDGEPGALRQAEKQSGGLDLKRRERAGRHLCPVF